MVTEINFLKSNELERPSIHICPEFSKAYDEEAMIDTRREGVDEYYIFDQVTLNITQIIQGILFEFVGDNGGRSLTATLENVTAYNLINIFMI